MIVCRNPDLAREREDLRLATERDLAEVAATIARKTDQIAKEAALDGLCAVRTRLPKDKLADEATARAYKSLSMVERAIRCLKTVDLHVRPIRHWLEERVRPHVFLCLLAYYLEWSLRARFARCSMTTTTQRPLRPHAKVRSPRRNARPALAKSATGRAADGAPVHSFQNLPTDLATLPRNPVVTAMAPDRPFTILTRPTQIQRKAFDLLSLPIVWTQQEQLPPRLSLARSMLYASQKKAAPFDTANSCRLTSIIGFAPHYPRAPP